MKILHGELPVVVSATVLTLATFAVSGVADTVFIFQRAEEVSDSPSRLVHAIFGAVRALITAAACSFAVRAVVRLLALKGLRAN